MTRVGLRSAHTDQGAEASLYEGEVWSKTSDGGTSVRKCCSCSSCEAIVVLTQCCLVGRLDEVSAPLVLRFSGK